MTKFEKITQLEERYKALDSDLDNMSWKNEVGLEVDMAEWYSTIDKMESVQRQIARLRVETDPFMPDDSQPEPEESVYDAYVEWVQMTNELRHGLA